MSRRRIRVHIGEIVLHGFDPRDRRAIGDSVRRELSAALAARGLRHPVSHGIARIDAGSVRVQPRRADGIGTRIARALQGARRS